MVTVTRENMSLGPCGVAWKGTDLGGTDGAVAFTIEEATAMLRSAQTGETPLAEYHRGYNVEVRARLLEITQANMQSLFDEATATGGTTGFGHATVGQIKTTGALILTPLDTTAQVGAIKIPRATARFGGFSAGDPENPNIVEAVFTGTYDTATAAPFLFQAVDTTAPTVSSSTPASGSTFSSGTITILFSETLSSARVDDDHVMCFLQGTSTLIDCSLTLEDETLTIVMATAPVTTSVYRFVVTNVTDESGNPLATPWSVMITTA